MSWINDSKATNPGAVVAALEGLRPGLAGGRIVLIAGGQAKGADLRPLLPVVLDCVRSVVLIGEDAPLFEALLAGQVPLERAADLCEAVDLAAAAAQRGDLVLLSPACASLDMFDNFNHRGDAFKACVRERIG